MTQPHSAATAGNPRMRPQRGTAPGRRWRYVLKADGCAGGVRAAGTLLTQ
jgi:hypothetical protein